nr:hypothetical protein [Methylomarinum sp. Ch1-1]MDP4519665.1 hypothetical protein [Methylomarinum sp. Ch1-1]
MRAQMEASEQLDGDDFEIEFVFGASVSLTAGFVSWLLRGGALLSSLLSSLSLFKRFDPLAVVFRDSTDKEENNEDPASQDEVESMFSVRQ